MRNHVIRRGADERRRIQPPDLKVTAQRLRHSARLAMMALSGNDPTMGVDYLFDALEMLQQDLRHLVRPRRRSVKLGTA